MSNSLQNNATSLIEDCTRLLPLARKLVRSTLEEPVVMEELRRAGTHVGLAIEGIAAALEEDEFGNSTWLNKSITDLVNTLIGRAAGNRRRLGCSIASLREMHERRKQGVLIGDSSVFSMPYLLAFLHLHRKTGTLRVHLASEKIVINFEDGDLTSAYSSNSPRGSRLGEILVELGGIPRQSLDTFLVFYTAKSGRIGEALKLKDLVSEEGLRAALTCQIQRLFKRLMRAESATYEFRDGPPEEADDAPRLNVLQLLLESSDSIKEDAAAPHSPKEPAPVEPSDAVESSGPKLGTVQQEELPSLLPGEEEAAELQADIDKLRAEIRRRDEAEEHWTS